MAITDLASTFLSQTYVRITWTGAGAPYYVWVDGVFSGETSVAEWYINLSPGETVQVDVFESSSESPDKVFPGKLHIAWAPSTDADQYSIREWSGTAWVQKWFRKENSDTGQFKYITPYLDDDTEYKYRVVPINSDGMEGTPSEMVGLLIRKPDSVAYDVTLSASGEVEIDLG